MAAGPGKRVAVIGREVQRVPLSLTMMLVTTLFALFTGAASGETSEGVVDRWGFSLDNLRDGHLWTGFTGDWLVYDRSHWLSMLFLFTIFALPVEAIGGSWLLAKAFWLGSAGGTLITSILIWILDSPFDWHPVPNLIDQADIGGSVGTWSAGGTLCVLVMNQSPWISWPLRIGSSAYLLERLVAAHDGADIAHPIGFTIGLAVGIWHVHRHGAPARFRFAT